MWIALPLRQNTQTHTIAPPKTAARSSCSVIDSNPSSASNALFSHEAGPRPLCVVDSSLEPLFADLTFIVAIIPASIYHG